MWQMCGVGAGIQDKCQSKKECKLHGAVQIFGHFLLMAVASVKLQFCHLSMGQWLLLGGATNGETGALSNQEYAY